MSGFHLDSLVVTIMAGGEGKRMRSTLPKVLHLFRGKPMLVWVIEAAMALTPKKVVVITGKFHEQIIRTLSEYMDIFGIVFIQQKTPLGTGDAIKSSLGQYETGDRVLILNGDMPLIRRDVLEAFINNSKTECVVLSTRLENPHGYGRIICQEETLVNDFLYHPIKCIIEEKDATPEQRKINQVNAGLYLITGEVLHMYIPKITNENNQKEYYLTDIIGLVNDSPFDMITGHRVSTVLLEDDENIHRCLRGINTPEELEELADLEG
jgi:bifunctional UDP-N-acetylglucosamine pyrophosphorylase/glucosamine-1-phosphate N-acetyltransferase